MSRDKTSSALKIWDYEMVIQIIHSNRQLFSFPDIH